MVKIIVTGSEGFVGKALVTKLKKRNDVEVICIDRLIGIEADTIGEYMDDSVMAVFHLAAQTSVFNTDLKQIERDNIATFIEVVDQCNKYNVRLVYASSSTANDGNTTSLYGLSKRFDEEFASMYAKNAIGVRLHNVYGHEQRHGTLLNILMTQPEVTLFNNGQNVRCFTYIDDATDGLIAAYGYTDYRRKIVNVVNFEPITIKAFAEEVQKYNDVKLVLDPNRRERDNVTQSVDGKVFTIPVTYRSYREGLKSIFKK